MKVCACVANFVGKELALFLTKSKHDIEFVITCEDDPYEEEIYNIFSEAGIKCHRKLDVNSPEFIEMLNGIDMGFLLWWPTILKKEVIESVKHGFVNLHPSYLPYNRGKHPYYWSIVEGTPAGVTLHFIKPGIDDGDILFQQEIETSITTTGEELYNNSLVAIIDLFKEKYQDIIDMKYTPIKQKEDDGSFHWGCDLDKHSEIDLEKSYKAKDLLNIIRARTFNGSSSSYFVQDNKKYYINLKIYE